MPEGVEVKLSSELIQPLVLNKSITYMHTTPNSRYGYNNLLPPDYQNDDYTIFIQSVETKGKFMYWTLKHQAGPSFWLFITFGMSGQFSPTKGKHPCMDVKFNDGSSIYFNDPRHFGTVKFVNERQALDAKLASLGWDPFQSSVEDGLSTVQPHLADTKKPIGQVMLDQSVFAGSGNYLRAEALYEARISPWRPSNQLSEDEVKTLCTALKEVMEASYRHQGATILTYKTAYGEEGRYSSLFKVYGKKQDPEGRPIIKETTPEGRTMHWCPDIQK